MKSAWLVVVALVGACGTKPSATPDGDAPIDGSIVDGSIVDGSIVDGSPDASVMYGDPFKALQQMPGNCTLDGWCWKFPTPNGNNYQRVFGTGPDNIWLGAWGTVLQWNGTTWKQHHPPVVPGAQQSGLAYQFAGTSSTNMYLIYQTSLEHWDGSSWTILETLSLSGGIVYLNMWADPTGDVWVTSGQGTKRWHNGTPTQIPCNGQSIWGTSETDVFITNGITVNHWNGTTCTQIYYGPSKILSGFQGGPNDVWFSGLGGTQIHHWNGTTLSPVPMPAIPSGANGFMWPVGYVSRDDVWWFLASGGGGFVHWDGTSLTFVPAEHRFNAGAYIDHKFWFVGYHGMVATMPQPFQLEYVTGTGDDWGMRPGKIWGSADDNMYFPMLRTIRHWDGAQLTEIDPDPGNSFIMEGLDGIRTNGVDELFVSGYEQLPGPPGAYTQNVLLHFDGATWTRTPSIGRLRYYAVLGPGEALGVGTLWPDPSPSNPFPVEAPFAAYFHNGVWSAVDPGTTQNLTGVFAPDANHAWISGRDGTVLRWDRANPTVMVQASDVVSPGRNLGPIAGTPGSTWIADGSGVSAKLWHNTGSGWVQSPAPLLSVGGTDAGFLFVDPTTAYVSSMAQTHMRIWDGTTWSFHDIGASTTKPKLFRTPDGTTWAAGDGGALVHAP